jgi:putative phage-type endonuclease
MTITYHRDMLQGSDEWLAARCGMLTASEMGRIITAKTLKASTGDKSTAHFCEMLAQRITRYVEPQYVSDDMLRGQADEIEARAIYAKHRATVQEVGFVTNDEWGFTIGCSPDGLVGEAGLIEIKSRRQRFQAETILAGAMPDEYAIQVQTALIVTGRAWCDFISYSGGMPLAVFRVLPDEKMQAAIIEAARVFEAALSVAMEGYHRNAAGMIPTERRIEQEMHL